MIDGYDPRSQIYPAERRCLAEVPPGGVFLDVGACVGGASLVLLDTNPTAEIHAFEPNPHNAVHLRLLPELHVVEAAVGASSGNAVLYTTFETDDPRGDMLGSLRLRGIGGPGKHAVRVVALDDYCGKLGIGHVDLLKIDVEGHELDVFRGADRLLTEGRVDVAVFENCGGWGFMDGYVPSLDEVCRFVADRGYDVTSGPNDPTVRIQRR